MRAAQGTYAKVKYGQNVQTGEEVALKVMRATGCSPCSVLDDVTAAANLARSLRHAMLTWEESS